MTLNVLISTRESEYNHYAQAISAQENITIVDGNDPQKVDVIIYEPNRGFDDFSIYPNLKFIQSIWAGVDSLVGNKTITVPVARLVDDGLSEGMREYMLGHIMADHIEISRFERATKWDDRWLPLARHKTIGILGFGKLGESVAHAAHAFGFKIIGWSQSPKETKFENVTGAEGLQSVLARSDYLVLLLPHTPSTEDIVNDELLGHAKPDAMLLNAGRGALIDEEALLRVLDAGGLRRAVLDVFKTEPLPADHPFWTHPKILVTPHIAAKSRADTAGEIIRRNLENLAQGRELEFLVDFDRGY